MARIITERVEVLANGKTIIHKRWISDNDDHIHEDAVGQKVERDVYRQDSSTDKTLSARDRFIIEMQNLHVNYRGPTPRRDDQQQSAHVDDGLSPRERMLAEFSELNETHLNKKRR